jgi:hypothetical protein
MRNLTSSNSRMMAMAAAGLLLVVTLVVHGIATPAAAQQHACEPDAHRLCSQFIPDESTVASCLRRNMRNLNADCRAAMGAGKAAKRAARQKARKARQN